MAKKIAQLAVELLLKSKKFEGQLKTSARKTKRFGDAVEKQNGKLASMGRHLVAIAAPAAMGAFIKSNLEAVDAIGKTSSKLGIATEELTALQYAVSQTSQMTDRQFNVALQRMTRRLSDAASGAGPAAKAIEELGLSAQELAKAGPAKAVNVLADAFANVKDQGDRVRLAFALFDSEGVELVNTLQQGSQALEDLKAKARETGQTITGIEASKAAKALDAYNDAMGRVSRTMQRLAVEHADDVSNFIEDVADTAGNTAKFFVLLSEAIDRTVNGTGTAAAVAADYTARLEAHKKAVLESAGAHKERAVVISQATEDLINQYRTGQDAEQAAAQARESRHKRQQEQWQSELAFVEQLNTRRAQALESARLMELKLDSVKATAYAEEEARLRMSAMNREVRLQNSYMLEEQLVGEHLGRMREQERENQLAMTAIWQSGWEGRAQIMGGIMGNLSVLMQSESRKMFEVGKAAAISQTILSTYQGAQQAYTSLAGIPVVGPALGIAAATAAIAAGTVRVQNIANTSFGSKAVNAASDASVTAAANGGELPGTGGGGDGRPQQELIVQGDAISTSTLEEIFRDAQENNVELVGVSRG